jgi:hypothetical protein
MKIYRNFPALMSEAQVLQASSFVSVACLEEKSSFLTTPLALFVFLNLGKPKLQTAVFVIISKFYIGVEDE